MAKIVSGLFGLSPEQVQQQQDEQSLINAQNTGMLVERGSPGWGATAMGVSKIGSGLMKGLDSLLGIEDPKLMKARDITKILSEVNKELEGQPNVAVFDALADRLAKKGYGEEALIAKQKSQEAADKEREFSLKEQDLAERREILNINLNQKRADSASKIAQLQYKEQGDSISLLSRAYADPRSSQELAAQNFAKSLEVEDSSVVASAFKDLHIQLASLEGYDEQGNPVYLYTPSEAAKIAKDMLSQQGAVKKGTKWNPTNETEILFSTQDEIQKLKELRQKQIAPNLYSATETQRTTGAEDTSYKDGEEFTNKKGITYRYSKADSGWVLK